MCSYPMGSSTQFFLSAGSFFLAGRQGAYQSSKLFSFILGSPIVYLVGHLSCYSISKSISFFYFYLYHSNHSISTSWHYLAARRIEVAYLVSYRLSSGCNQSYSCSIFSFTYNFILSSSIQLVAISPYPLARVAISFFLTILSFSLTFGNLIIIGVSVIAVVIVVSSQFIFI